MSKKRPQKRVAARPPGVVALAAGLNESPRERWLQVALVFGLAVVVRGLHLFLMRDALLMDVLFCDAWQYDQWAQRVAGGDWLGSEVFYQTPLYPYLMAVLYTVFGYSPWLVRIVQALGGAVACVVLARAGTRFFSPRAGWAAGVLLALYPPAIFFDGIVQKASLDLLLMAALLWIVAVSQTQSRGWSFALAGAVLGLMTLNRENAAVLFPVLLAWIGWLGWSRMAQISWRQPAMLALGAALVLVPVGLRNYHVGGLFALTTSQMGPNFYIGNNPRANGGYETLRPDRGDPRYESQDARLLAEADLKRSLSPGEVSRYWMGRSWNYISSDPIGWLRLLAWKWYLTWNAAEMIDAESIYTHARHSAVLAGLGWVLHFGVLCPLAAAGLWWTRADWRRLAVLYAMLAAFAAAVTVFYVFGRYRYPLVPVATLFAGAALALGWERIRGQTALSTRDLAFGLGLALLVAIGCNWPFARLYDEDAITYYNAGTALLDSNRIDEAIEMLKLAEQEDPKFAATYSNLGRAATAKGNLDEARGYFEQAIQAEPKHAAYYLNLAGILSAQGQDERAIGHLQTALKLDPLLTPTYRLLGQLEIKHGNPSAGLAHLRRALEIEPNSALVHADLGAALAGQGQRVEAIQHLGRAFQLDRSNGNAANNLAWLLATAPEDKLRNGPEAVKLAQMLCSATKFQVPQLLDTLAAAQAEVGQFDKAIELVEQALKLPAGPEFKKSLEAHREQYRARKPLRDGALQIPSTSG